MNEVRYYYKIQFIRFYFSQFQTSNIIEYLCQMKEIMIYVIFLLIPVVNNAKVAELDSKYSINEDIFAEVNLAEVGLNSDVFSLALKGLKKLEANGKLQNSDIITIADYSQSSNKKRLYVIDLKNKKLLFNTYVAHGRNTGEEFAKSFSNKEGSNKSSLGFYVTENPIIGSHTGFALLINGVEKGFNDHAIQREIIIHAAEYATENFIKKHGRLGRSYGCPSLPPDMNKPIIDAIQGGTCLFLYNPDKDYINKSSLLN